MTHDELLEKIDTHEEYYPDDLKNALRAVVELHKPIKSPHYGDLVCSCNVSEDYQYPCPTIQAIEKALS